MPPAPYGVKVPLTVLPKFNCSLLNWDRPVASLLIKGLRSSLPMMANLMKPRPISYDVKVLRITDSLETNLKRRNPLCLLHGTTSYAVQRWTTGLKTTTISRLRTVLGSTKLGSSMPPYGLHNDWWIVTWSLPQAPITPCIQVTCCVRCTAWTETNLARNLRVRKRTCGDARNCRIPLETWEIGNRLANSKHSTLKTLNYSRQW